MTLHLLTQERRPSTFSRRRHAATVAACSALAVVGATAYFGMTNSPALSATYSASRHPVVEGVVKSDGRTVDGADVRVRFVVSERRRDGLGTRLGPWIVRHTNLSGRWSVPTPPGAIQVRVRVGVGGRSASGVYALRQGETLSTTAVFPASGSGLLPAIFPY